MLSLDTASILKGLDVIIPIDKEINPAIIDDQDPEMLQDLVIMAVNDALQKAKKAQEDTLGKYTKGLPGF